MTPVTYLALALSLVALMINLITLLEPLINIIKRGGVRAALTAAEIRRHQRIRDRKDRRSGRTEVTEATSPDRPVVMPTDDELANAPIGAIGGGYGLPVGAVAGSPAGPLVGAIVIPDDDTTVTNPDPSVLEDNEHTGAHDSGEHPHGDH